MIAQSFLISRQPKYPFAERTLVYNTEVKKLQENIQYAKIIFDLLFHDINGVPADGMTNQTKEFFISNDHWVDVATGMKIPDPVLLHGGVPCTSSLDVNGVAIYSIIPNMAKQFDFFQTMVDNKIFTEKELLIKYVAECDKIQYFD